MTNKLFLVLLLSIQMCLGCTAIPDAGTRVYVYERMNRVQNGNTTEQVQYLLSGPPSYVTAMQQGADTFELWEYRIGNFLYAQPALILFKNGRVIALPKNSQEIIGILYSQGVVRDVQFWNNKDQ